MDVASGKLVSSLKESGYENYTFDIWQTFSHNGNLLALVGTKLRGPSDRYLLKLWDLTSDKLFYVFELPEELDFPKRIEFSSDDTYILLVTSDGIYRYDLTTKNLTRLPIPPANRKADRILINKACSKAVVKIGTSIELFDVHTGQKLADFAHVNANQADPAISANGELVADASKDNTITIWDTYKKTEVAQLIEKAPVYKMEFSDDGKRLAVLTDGKTITVWDVETKLPIRTFENGYFNYSFYLTTDGVFLLDDGYNMQEIRIRKINNGMQRVVTKVALSKDAPLPSNLVRSRLSNSFAAIAVSGIEGGNTPLFVWSLDRMVKALDSVAKLSVSEQLLLTALLTVDNPAQISPQTLDSIMPLLDDINPTIREIVLQPFQKNQPIQDQSAPESFVQRFMKWFKRNQNQ